MKRYKLTSPNTLADTKKDKIFSFKKVRADTTGRYTMLCFRLEDDTEKRVAEHTVDLNGKDLGLG